MSIPSLAELDYVPYLNEEGLLTPLFDGKVGVYAIFDRAQTLQFVGYSRDVSLSLKQHLVRQPQQCFWVKGYMIDRPSRTLLEEIRAAWFAENGELPIGNGPDEALWTQPIDAKAQMSANERSALSNCDDLGKVKLLKQVARRVEETVLADLDQRGVKIPIRFDPKQKEEGLLNLK